ncbi:MAG: MBL fold metallo-hydrolase [Candidatus Schekmanbacteria bacterium]|nr:MBL fold metallo-hydrolase [Candidatus Schekmanbacteria bacterium]
MTRVANEAGIPIVCISLPTPFPIGPVNAFVLDTDPLVMIDAGPATQAAESALRAGLREHGIDIRRIEIILATHGHVDHVGLAGLIQDGSSAALRMHVADAWRLARPELGLDQARSFFRSIAATHGVPPEQVSRVEQMAADNWSMALPCEPGVPLADGEELIFAHGRLRVLHTPGHTPGSVCFWEETTGTLIAGDTVLRVATPNALLEPGGTPASDLETRPVGDSGPMSRYLNSLERLACLDVRRVFPGHGAAFDDAARVLERITRQHRRRTSRIAALLDQQADTAFGVAHRLFPGLKPEATLMAVNETIAGLMHLEADGAVCRSEGAQAQTLWMPRVHRQQECRTP